jgi:hypothetical protein
LPLIKADRAFGRVRAARSVLSAAGLTYGVHLMSLTLTVGC